MTNTGSTVKKNLTEISENNFTLNYLKEFKNENINFKNNINLVNPEYDFKSNFQNK